MTACSFVKQQVAKKKASYKLGFDGDNSRAPRDFASAPRTCHAWENRNISSSKKKKTHQWKVARTHTARNTAGVSTILHSGAPTDFLCAAKVSGSVSTRPLRLPPQEQRRQTRQSSHLRKAKRQCRDLHHVHFTVTCGTHAWRRQDPQRFLISCGNVGREGGGGER